MKSRKAGIGVFVLVVGMVLMLVAGCSSKPKSYSGVEMSSQMKESPLGPQVMSYRNPDVDLRQYKQVMVTPVEIYTGPDANWKGVTQEEQEQLAAYLYQTTVAKLGEKGLYTDRPGPGVARLKLILAGVDKTRPVASTVTHALPVGLALNLGKGAMGKSGSFMGDATVGGEFTDSQTGNLVATFLAKEAPNAMDIPVIFSEWDASKKALDKVAQQIATRIEDIQTGKG